MKLKDGFYLKISALCLALFTFLALLSGCEIFTALRLDSNNDSYLNPTLAPTMPYPPENELYDELYPIFFDNFDSSLFIVNNWSLKYGYDFAQNMTININRYILKAALVQSSIDTAVDAVYSYLAEQKNDLDRDFHISYPSFQFLASTLPFINDKVEFLALLNISFNIQESNVQKLIITIKPYDIVDFANIYSKGDFGKYIDIRFTYAYLTSVYDDYGNESIDNVYSFPSNVMKTLHFPLKDHYYSFHDSWCDTRSNNTRKHMGTDIKADQGTDILSISPGIVTAIGCGNIPGNFVIITDSFGYEYHYYHMLELTRHVKVGDTVATGDVIGNIGSTGNSDANHLHISIISPDGKFVNPYKLMHDLQNE
ncbi:MAG: M23 family metallopeptidase [Clostridia bacterium]